MGSTSTSVAKMASRLCTPRCPGPQRRRTSVRRLISLSRRFVEAHEALRRGEWQRLTGDLWDGKTLGILGCGRIGRQVSVIANAFRMKVLAYDIVEDPLGPQQQCHLRRQRNPVAGK